MAETYPQTAGDAAAASGGKIKLCRDCKSPMPADANKCVPCGAFQGASRYLTFSNSVLSLLVALVSVAAFAIPAISNALRPAAVDQPSATFIVAENGAVTIQAANNGDATAVLKSADLVFDLNLGGATLVPLEFLGLTPGDRAIGPHANRVFQARIPADKLDLASAMFPPGPWAARNVILDQQCYLAVTFVGVKGDQRTLRTPLDCKKDLYALINDVRRELEARAPKPGS
jgi:hypothetical protein